MNKMIVKVVTESNLTCHFILQDIDGNKQKKMNRKAAEFNIEKNKKYAMVILVHGDNGTKYKISISGATKASYPEGLLELDDQRDEWLARITG